MGHKIIVDTEDLRLALESVRGRTTVDDIDILLMRVEEQRKLRIHKLQIERALNPNSKVVGG